MAPVHPHLDNWQDWNAYPKSWPRTGDDGKLPIGLVKLSPEIEQSARSRLAGIRHDLEKAGSHYPREEVLKVLAYWKISESDGTSG